MGTAGLGTAGLAAAAGLPILLYAVLAVARWPGGAITVLVPLLMWPRLLHAGPVPVQQALTAVLAAGLLLAGRRTPAPARLVPVSLTIGALLVASRYLHEPTEFVLPSEARNSMLAVLLDLALVVAVAKSRPAPAVGLRAVAIGGLLFTAYVLAHGGQLGGRIDLAGLNPNAAGHAAALDVLALAATAALTGQRRWLLATPLPLALVYLAQSRGGLVVLGVGAVCAVVLSHRGALRTAATLLGFGAALIGWRPVAQLTSDSLLAARDAGYVSTDARTGVLRLASRLVVEHPATGVGYGRFPDLSGPELGLALNTHNDWVRIAVEAGLPAAALLAALVAVPLTYPLPGSYAVPIKAMLAAGCASWLFANVMTDARVALPVWLAAALAWSMRTPAAT